MFTVEGAPHHYILPASAHRLEAYLDGNSAPPKDYLRQQLALNPRTYIVWVDMIAVRDYMQQPIQQQ